MAERSTTNLRRRGVHCKVSWQTPDFAGALAGNPALTRLDGWSGSVGDSTGLMPFLGLERTQRVRFECA